MRTKVKKQIMEMIGTLEELADFFYKADPEAKAVMTDDITAFIGAIKDAVAENSSKEIEESGKKLLEVFLAGTKEASDNENADIHYAINEYKRLISDIQTTFKVVFLPYYENTWDSLESVYEAFAADRMFEVEIVIIPIRRNTATGYAFVYEDYLTPKGIPNTHYNEYSFEDDLPDIVFFNNPYDGVNIPKFQSNTFRPYVGLLVYVPYHINLTRHEPGLNSNPNNVAAQEKNELAALTGQPSHQNCDIYVAQCKEFITRYGKEKKIHDKMVALGNPKTDRLYRSLSEDWWQRTDWEEKIKGKKVLLLNTHYSVFAPNNNSFRLKNCYYIIEPLLLFAEENPDKAAIIWRPHPQTSIVIGNARTESTEYFEELRQRFRTGSNTVLDESDSSTSALLYCDALVSSWSSIIMEAVFLNKPVFLSDSPKLWNIIKTPNYIEKKEHEQALHDSSLWSVLSTADPDERVYNFRNLDAENSGAILRYMTFSRSIVKFLADIIAGIDIKKEMREKYREIAYENRVGTCGMDIYKHVKARIIADI